MRTTSDFYPASRIDVWQLQDGRRIMLRPILPQDCHLLGEMIAGLSASTKRLRCHGAVNAFSASRLAQMSEVDHKNHVAFVITECAGDFERIIADARYVVDKHSSQDSAEFAIVVDDQWQHMGLGEHCMSALTKTALNDGLRWLHGDILTHNERMLALMERCHFFCTPDRSNDSIVRAELQLNDKNIAADMHPHRSRMQQWVHQLLHAKRNLKKQVFRSHHA